VTLHRIGSWDFFGEVVEAGFHERALQMVASGEIDGAAIDSHVLGVALRNAPQLVDLIRVVETLGPSPSQPVVVKSDLDSALKEQIRSRLLELRDPLMTEFLVEGFAPAPDYSKIAAVVGASSR
jgi:phosphonate transport system substrate-binding protein